MGARKSRTRRILRGLLWSFVGLLSILLLCTGLLLLPAVQTFLARQLSARLSKDLGTTIRIERVEIRPFSDNRLHGVYVADLEGDTLITANELWLRFPAVSLSLERISLRKLELHGAHFHLHTRAGHPHSNLTELLDRLGDSDTTTSDADWRIVVRKVDIRDLHFSFMDDNIERLPFGVDFDHVDVRHARIAAHDLRIAGDSILAVLDSIRLTEHSGLTLDHLSGATHISPRGIIVEHLALRTPSSDIKGDLALRTDSFGDLSHFTTNVRMRVDLDTSRVQFSDIALFAPDLQGMSLPVRVAGHVRGTVNEMKGRDIDLRLGMHTLFRGDVELSGLPDFANTFMVVDVDHFIADPNDLARVPVPPFTSSARLEPPAEMQRLGTVGFSGNFTGFPSSFTTYGSISTDAGALRTDVTYQRDTITQVIALRGSVATGGFNLGQVLADPNVGVVACDLHLTAKGRNVASANAELEGTIQRLDLIGRSVGDITLNGRLERNLFNGRLTCNDPNLQLDFDGLADLRGRWPKVDFNAQVRRMDLRALGVIGGHGFSDLVFDVRAEGELAPDSLKGSVYLSDVLYCEDTTDLDVGDISLRSWFENGEGRIGLESDPLDLQVNGSILPTRLPDAVMSVLYSVFPSLEEQVLYPKEEQHFTFTGTVGEAQPVLDLLVPGLEVAEGTRLSGGFDSRSFDLYTNVEAPLLGYEGIRGDSVSIVLDKTIDMLTFRLRSTRQMLSDSLVLGDIEITGKAYQDEIQFSTGWTSDDGNTNGRLNANALVVNGHRMEVEVQPSQLFLGRGDWTSQGVSHIVVDSSTIQLDTLELANADQRVRLAGTVGMDTAMALAFDLRNVALENLRPLMDGPALHGKLSGEGELYDLYRSPYLISELRIDSLAIEKHPVGDLRFTATWNEGERAIDVNGSLQRDTLQALDFNGKVAPGREQELDIDLVLDRFDLRFLDPYLPEAISDIQGRVSGTIDVTGTLETPLINGSALLEEAGLRINYLNTFYKFTHRVDIRPDMFALDNVVVVDERGNTARLVGTIIHHGLSDWNFDVSGTMQHFLVLNTSVVDNELFYGDAYATGDINVGGYLDNLEISLNASTGKGTDIHFPLGGSKDVGGIPFVRFIAAGTLNDTMVEALDLTGIRLDLNVQVTPDAVFELIFDPTVGDIMRGSGRGNIAMTVTPSGEFSMKGDVELVEGDYLFTLRNLVNKRFGVEPGGRISWYGDPFDATISIDAIYKLRAALYDVMPAALRTEAYKKRVPVEVIMHLTQRLMNPDIAFDVRLPSVDEAARTQVQSALATTDDLNKQVFSLVMLNRFLPTDATAGGENTSGLGAGSATTGTELLSNQVSNWLSQVSNDFDLGVNWRAGDNITQDEVELAVSTQILNDRLQISTNVGVQYGSTGTQQNNLIGDFSAEYMLTQDGKLRLKAYSQSNDRNLNQVDQAPYTQGAGVGYREDFNDLPELWQKLRNIFRPDERDVKFD
ncbi:MAG TPA: translocation/assembly module TamB domain-containing protein [Flavobacteriales bacterium]